MKKQLLAHLSIAVAVLFATAARADDAADKKDDAGTEQAIDPKVVEIIKSYSDYLSGMKSFRVALTAAHETVSNGKAVMKQSPNGILTVKRPNMLSLPVMHERGGGGLFCDGEKAHVYDLLGGRYGNGEAPEHVFHLSQAIVKTFNTVPATLALLSTNPAATLMENLEIASYKGLRELDGHKHHVVKLVNRGDVEATLWFTTGDKPLLSKAFYDIGESGQGLRIVTMRLSDWEVDPDLPDDNFSFSLPDGVQEDDDFFLVMAGKQPAHPLTGKPAPKLKLSMLGGGVFDLSSHKDKNVVVLHFWREIYNQPKITIPVVLDVVEKKKDKGVVFCSVNQAGKVPKIVRYRAKLKRDFPVALDDKKIATRAFQTLGQFQSVLIIDKDGTVQAVHSGPLPDFQDRFTADLEDVLAGKKVFEQKKWWH